MSRTINVNVDSGISISHRHLSIPTNNLFVIGCLVDFRAGEHLANPAEKVDGGWLFHENGVWTVAKALGSATSNTNYVNQGWLEEFDNGVYMESLSEDWSIVLFKSIYYAVHNADLTVKS